MDVSFQLRLDAEREHLMVQQSFVGVFGSKDAKHGLFHYDYERDKVDGYPDAHLQVDASSDFFGTLNDPQSVIRAALWGRCTSRWAGSGSGPAWKTSSSS
jgi:hypothetical protein